MIDEKKVIEPALKTLLRVSDVLKRNKMTSFFLVNRTAVAASTKSFKDLKTLHIGIEWDDFKGKKILVFSKDFDIKEITDPFNFIRGCIIRDKTTGVKVIFCAYFREGKHLWCPFSKPGKSMTFLHALIDPGQKVKLKNRWFKIPSPIDDYIADTFNTDLEYKKSDLFVYID